MSISGLHDPSSGSDPTPSTSSSSSSSPPTIQSEALLLTSLKDSITARLDVYYGVLKTNNCTTSTPLVDPEGFPRADIDVAGVRTARVQIIRLKNDLKGVMKEMEHLLERGLPNDEGAEEEEEPAEPAVEEGKTPFARVDGVFPGGPAAVAGLQRGDEIISIGSVNVTNHDNLKNLAALVNRSEGTVVPLVVLRPIAEAESAILQLRLIPKTGWGGRGLLGCHVVLVG